MEKVGFSFTPSFYHHIYMVAMHPSSFCRYFLSVQFEPNGVLGIRLTEQCQNAKHWESRTSGAGSHMSLSLKLFWG